MIPHLILRTEVLPKDLPLMFSNRSLYTKFYNFRINDDFDKLNSKKNSYRMKYTIPLNYYIPKGNNDFRKLSILHPLAQLQVTEFLLVYRSRIISECLKSNFSVRSPIKLNNTKIDMKNYSEWKLQSLKNEFATKEVSNALKDLADLNYSSFFSYNKFKSIREMMESPTFNRLKHRYKYSLKIDIQKCFGSIYTHSFTWAILGSKEIGKAYLSGDSFAHRADKIMQITNYNETNGIIVGNEFSRVMAEILLSHIDLETEYKIKENFQITLNKDYTIYRFVDDYYIFAHNKEDILNIKKILNEVLNNFNLNINESKVLLQESPFHYYDSSILKLKNLINNFKLAKVMYEPKDGDKNKIINIGTRSDWKFFHSNIEEIIISYPESQGRIVKYFLKVVRDLVDFNPQKLSVNKEMIEAITNIYNLYIDMDSTNSYITVMLKLFLKVNQESPDDLLANEKVKVIIEELIFENCFRVIKNKEESLEYMTDLITFMKILKRKINPQYLCKILDKNNENYFVYCCIGHYILIDGTMKVDPKYQTVHKKLISKVNSKIYSYDRNNNLLYNAEYFYILNDFSKYPGFENFKNILDECIKENLPQDANKKIIAQELWDDLTSRSYYEWSLNTDNFQRSIIKKIMYNHWDINFTSAY
ncbi:hypothetical protein CW684_06975 [Macrococcoides caseolyticum]|uniref:Reverse transcriptase n=1 Tax=Macrococcoides caseolyticum TaxID=69966 RepID=A0A1S7BGL9_9STAP|nr:RNA-directed DNA polymerase [Macrococcus caseolyticus]AQX82826.1 Putative reverse transcriptase [Macrococcus caseolyticus]PKE50300.1 hypothetical protein CW672_05730 [Macrococcus caseolyticus]PKF21082.1 hypothetical protein CW684_06975 [Macrococcus caseolyticus]PKF34391.1 hypothetical protein CW687_07475 [Macrococcus caseolyticus]